MKKAFDQKIFDHFDWPLVTCLLMILGIGLANLYSATFEMKSKYFTLQLTWMGIGFLIIFLLLFFDYRLLERIAYPFYAITVFFLIYVLFKGKTSLGAQRWIQIGSLTIQPSEVIKPAIAMVLAKYFHSKRSHGALSLRDLFLPGVLSIVPIALILKQPDLGTALIVAAISGSMIFFVGVEKKIVISFLIIGLVAIPLAWNFGLKQYQKDRIYMFLSPEKDAKGKGYQTIQSRITIGSGQLIGKGYMKGSQTKLKFLPKQHTDFIFSNLAEEFGFAGSLLVVLLYASFGFLGVKISQTAKEKFGMMLAFGMTSLIISQTGINIAMETGLLPVVGVPLPLFSYGGTSLLSSLLAVGVLLNISMRRYLF